MQGFHTKYAQEIKELCQFIPELNEIKHKLIHPLWGIDVVVLDDLLTPPDGTSLRDYISANYGTRAVELIELLIDGRPDLEQEPQTGQLNLGV